MTQLSIYKKQDENVVSEPTAKSIPNSAVRPIYTDRAGRIRPSGHL